MKLLELECKNCGASLKGNDELMNCPYCGASYKIDDEAEHIKYEDMENSGYEFEKGRIKAQTEHIDKNNSVYKFVPIIFVVIFFITTFMTIGIMFVNGFSMMKKTNNIILKSSNRSDIINNILENNKNEEELKRQEELERQKESFNLNFSSGRKATVFVESMLNNAIHSNQTNKERQITVVYQDISTENIEQIMDVIKKLERYSQYDVIIGYDKDGFVNKITIK